MIEEAEFGYTIQEKVRFYNRMDQTIDFVKNLEKLSKEGRIILRSKIAEKERDYAFRERIYCN